MLRRLWWLSAMIAPLLLTGCGADPEAAEPANDDIIPAAVSRGAFHDWEAVQLNNGLATIAVVPKLGGRVLGYEFAGQPMVYANPKLYGALPGQDPGNRRPWVPGTVSPSFDAPEVAPTGEPTDAGTAPRDRGPAAPEPGFDLEEVPGGGVEGAEPAESAGPIAAQGPAQPMPEAAEVGELIDSTAIAAEEPLRYVPSPRSREYANYGGALGLPGPRSHWPRPWPPPLALDLGEYAAEVGEGDGSLVAVSLQGPADDELGVELSRRVALLRGSTVMRVEHTLKNTGNETRPWSIADLSQHPGALAGGETFTKDVRVYLPLDPDSPRNLDYAALIGPQVHPQYTPSEGLLQVEYLGAEGMVGSDAKLGWIAWADHRHGTVLVKIAHLEPEAHYPEQGITATVYTSPAESESYVELGLRSPLRELKSGDTMRFAVEYGAARCPAPIVAASNVGCVNTPLTAERLADSDRSVALKGIFGVFYAGQAQIAFFDAEGEVLARTQPVTVTPREEFRLDTIAPLPDGAVRAAVVIVAHSRVDVGELADCSIVDAPAPPPDGLAAPALSEVTPLLPGVPEVELAPGEGPSLETGPAMPDAPETPADDQPAAPEPIRPPETEDGTP